MEFVENHSQRSQCLMAAGESQLFYTSVPSPPWAHLPLPPSVPSSKSSLTPSLLAGPGGL